MSVHSAGVLLHHVDGSVVRVFLAHMGGPFWRRKEAGAWTVPKGEFVPDEEDARQAAAREFEEEIGVVCPPGLDKLGTFRQSGGKVVHVFVTEAAPTLAFVRSNEFQMEWPPGSGAVRSFPEIDRAKWCTVAEARDLIVKGQQPALEALMQRLRADDESVLEGGPGA